MLHCTNNDQTTQLLTLGMSAIELQLSLLIDRTSKHSCPTTNAMAARTAASCRDYISGLRSVASCRVVAVEITTDGATPPNRRCKTIANLGPTFEPAHELPLGAI